MELSREKKYVESSILGKCIARMRWKKMEYGQPNQQVNAIVFYVDIRVRTGVVENGDKYDRHHRVTGGENLAIDYQWIVWRPYFINLNKYVDS